MAPVAGSSQRARSPSPQQQRRAQERRRRQLMRSVTAAGQPLPLTPEQRRRRSAEMAVERRRLLVQATTTRHRHWMERVVAQSDEQLTRMYAGWCQELEGFAGFMLRLNSQPQANAGTGRPAEEAEAQPQAAGKRQREAGEAERSVRPRRDGPLPG